MPTYEEEETRLPMIDTYKHIYLHTYIYNNNNNNYNKYARVLYVRASERVSE